MYIIDSMLIPRMETLERNTFRLSMYVCIVDSPSFLQPPTQFRQHLRPLITAGPASVNVHPQNIFRRIDYRLIYHIHGDPYLHTWRPLSPPNALNPPFNAGQSRADIVEPICSHRRMFHQLSRALLPVDHAKHKTTPKPIAGNRRACTFSAFLYPPPSAAGANEETRPRQQQGR